ncbi:GntR family transcriptional regulator [Streptomyces sp. NPDC090077]|uniref:GntR family transcriptional regulator n=1 Tax=Streptomyces sp. NPDC090077 TaxID=3365938 RepID=UPI0038008F20
MSAAQRLPAYRQVANEIIERIKSGELQPGDPIPSARKIVEEKGISSATAARVLGTLRDEGWADTSPGRRTVVRAQTVMTQGANRIGMIRRGDSGLLDGETVEFVEARAESASQEVADALGIEAGGDVVMRRRRYVDPAGVSVVSSTWITAALGAVLPEFTQPEKLPKMTMGLIEDRTQRRAARQRDTYSVAPVPEDVASHLGVTPGERVLKVTNRYVDQEGEPTEYAIDWHAPGRSWVAEGPVG